MAITTYSELQDAIADRLGNTSFTAAQKQECIALCEARMQRDLRTLDMETKSASFSITGEFVAVPTDFLAVRAFWLNLSPRYSLRYLADELQANGYTGTGKPKFFSVVGSNFHFAPPPDGTYTATLVYYAKIPALSGTTTTNWLLTAHPDVYLYGSLREAYIRLKDIDAAQGCEGLYQDAMQAIQKNADRNRWTGPSMVVVPA